LKNLMLYVVENPAAELASVRRNLDLQVANTLELGWDPRDVILYTNFPYAKDGIAAIPVSPPPRPPKARATAYYKTFCIVDALARMVDDELVWYHDVDTYQLIPFVGAPTSRTVAFCLYCTRERLLIQGGSMFFNHVARPLFEQALDLLVNHRYRTDELAITDLISRREHLDRFEVLDYSYNLGHTDFAMRYQLALKPIKAVHFHVERSYHREVFLGANPLGVKPLGERFTRLLERWDAQNGGAPRDDRRSGVSRRFPALGRLLSRSGS
jgi:hypothetical protein